MDQSSQAVAGTGLEAGGTADRPSSPQVTDSADAELRTALSSELAARRDEVRERDRLLAEANASALRSQAMISDLSNRLGAAMSLAAEERRGREALQAQLTGMTHTRSWRFARFCTTVSAALRRRARSFADKVAAPFRRSG